MIYNNSSLFDVISALTLIIGSPVTVAGIIFTLKKIAEKVGLDIKKANLENDLNLVPDYDISQLRKLVEEEPKEESIFGR